MDSERRTLNLQAVEWQDRDLLKEVEDLIVKLSMAEAALRCCYNAAAGPLDLLTSDKSATRIVSGE